MRIGIVCPYSFEAPGGVQFHTRDLAEALRLRGHEVSVLAPAAEDTKLPAHVVSAGRALPVHYNGSVARLAFGPVVANRVRKWLAVGQFDVLHLHEPAAPSLSMLALWIADGPIVATFHTSLVRSRPLQLAYPFFRQFLEKITARIAVSEDARRTLVDHLGGDAVVIPNGVWVDQFTSGPVEPRWVGTSERPTVAFLGRLDEPRKGLAVLLSAVALLRERIPQIRLLVAGQGSTGAQLAQTFGVSDLVEFLGPVDDATKAQLLRSVDVYCAPQTGGESFGIVLVEAMSAGTCVVASDLGAFSRVLDDPLAGVLFQTGDSESLAAALAQILGDDAQRAAIAECGRQTAARYDWQTVVAQIEAVYETVSADAQAPVGEDPQAARRAAQRTKLSSPRGGTTSEREAVGFIESNGEQ